MPESRTCPKCQAELPEDSPDGLCPKCLLLAGLEDSDEPHEPAGGSAFAATTPQSGGFKPPAPNLLARRFPRLEIIELIGHGGMGAVYKARQTKLDRLVALKIIRPESADDPAFAERFNREARTLARLNHPNIVAIYDFGEVQSSHHAERDGYSETTLYYFIMEYVDGANLRHLIQAGDLQPDQALAIVPQVCDALQFAHDEGIVHRDIKPENILVDQRGRVKIADFGLAKLATRSDQDFTLTGTHQVMGTPRYMAPEQMEGSHTVDHRADIYSLGVVFYEMLTGQVPAGHFDPPSKRNGIDARLDQVVLRALARDPDRRYQKASEISSHVNVIRGVTSDLGSTPAVQSDWHAIPELLPGPSTILDRAVSRIVGGIRHGGVQRSLTHPAGPSVVAILLSLSVIGTLFVPWGLNLNTANAVHDGWIYGYTEVMGNALGVVCFLLVLTLLAADTTRRIQIWRPWSILLTGVLSLVLLATFFASVSPGIAWSIQAGFLISLGLSVALITVAAWDLRLLLAQRAVDQATERPDEDSSSVLGGRDWVTLTREQIESDELPDLCIVCGRPTQQRINKNFSFQAQWAQTLSTIGLFFGVLPGLIIASLTERQQRIACPVCPRHRDHWSKFIWWCSTGWLIPVALAVPCGFTGYAVSGEDDVAMIAIMPALVVGFAIYLVPVVRMATTRVDAEKITDTEIRLRRVSTVFARAVGERGLLPSSARSAPAHEVIASADTPASKLAEGAQPDRPRVSRKAIVGACVSLLSLVGLLLLTGIGLFITSRGAAEGGFTATILFPFIAIALPAGITGIVATILGWVAISDIRQSNRRLTGLPLAVADAMAFPLLLANGVMFGLCLYFFHSGIEMNFAMSLFLAGGQTAVIGGWLSSDIVRRVWHAVAPSSNGSSDPENPENDDDVSTLRQK